VVEMAVRNAVSAATMTFTASSMMRCFFIDIDFFSLNNGLNGFYGFLIFWINFKGTKSV
jgi:hypothetical protein